MAESLRRVAAGLTLLFNAGLLSLFATGVAVGGVTFLLAANPDAGRIPVAKWVGLTAYATTTGGVWLVASACGLVGRVRCAAVPEEFGPARPLIRYGVVADAAALAVAVPVLGMTIFGRELIPPEVDLAAELLHLAIKLAGVVLLLKFLRAVAAAVREPRLERAAGSVLRLALVAVGCHVATLGVVALGAAAAGLTAGIDLRGRPPAALVAGMCVGAVLGLTAVGCLVTAFIKYMLLLRRLRAAVRGYAVGLEHRAVVRG